MSINCKISKCLLALLNIRIIRKGGALGKSWHLLFSPDFRKAAFYLNWRSSLDIYLFVYYLKSYNMLNEINAGSQYVMETSIKTTFNPV